MTMGTPDPVEMTTKLPSWVPRFSLVVPTYNVAAYIDAFFESVFAQTSKTQRFEVIIVDDGSTDNSGQIALAWAQRYPDQIRYIRQDKHGLSQARNTGLQAARGAWVSFPDPDDFLDLDYFRVMLEQTVVPHDNPLLMIVSKLLPYLEATGTSVDNHPLDYRFKDGLRYVDTSNMEDFIHLSSASCWFNRGTLMQHKLRFNSRVQPVFEDGHLVTKLIMLSPQCTIAVVPDAVYHYRKRADASSLVMGAKTTKGFYLDTVEYGYLDLMLFAKAKLGHVPAFVQRVCLYELQSRIKYLIGDDTRIDVLNAAEKTRFIALLECIFNDISLEIIQDFQIGRFDNQQRIALIARFKSAQAISPLLYAESFDARTGLARFSYYTGATQIPDVRLICDGQPLKLTSRSTQWTDFAGAPFLGQHRFYVRIPKTGVVRCQMGETDMQVRRIRWTLTEPLTYDGLAQFMRMAPTKGLSAEQRALRHKLEGGADTYAGSWLLMGTAMLAGADAPAVYRYLADAHKGQAIWFVLSVLSPDWGRLMAAGVRLLPYGSEAHAHALVQADMLITSCPDVAHHWPAGQVTYAGLGGVRIVVLPQHTTPPKTGIDYLCVPSLQVAEVLTGPDHVPRWFRDEILLTGYPRHEAITSVRPQAKTVLIVPDWMVDICREAGQNPYATGALNPTDIAQYRSFWEAFLQDDLLKQVLRDHKLKLRILGGWVLGQTHSQVEVMVPGEGPEVMRDAVARAGMVITDRLDVACDAAYQKRGSVLCRKTSDLPLPPQIALAQTVADVVTHIVTHYGPRQDDAKPTDFAPYFPQDDMVACARLVAALAKIDAVPDAV